MPEKINLTAAHRARGLSLVFSWWENTCWFKNE